MKKKPQKEKKDSLISLLWSYPRLALQKRINTLRLESSFLQEVNRTPKRTFEKESALYPLMYEDWHKARGLSNQDNYKDYQDLYGVLSWVYACVYAITTSVASLPLKLRDKKTQELIEDHSVLELLQAPNPDCSYYDLIEALSGFMELTGNGYIEKVREQNKPNGLPVELYVWPSDRMRIIPGSQKKIDGYYYEYNGSISDPIPSQDILHFKYFNSTSDYYGLSAIQAIKSIITTDLYSINYNKKFFENSATISGVLETEIALSDITFERLKKEFELKYQGHEKAHKTLILEEGLKWKAIGISQKDMEFLQQRKFNREEILAVFGVPPAMVGLYESGTTWGQENVNTQKKSFWEETIIPKLRKKENVLNSYLLPEFDKAGKLEFFFDVSNVEALKENETEKINRFNVFVTGTGGLVSRGSITGNEERRLIKNQFPDLIRDELEKDLAWGNIWFAPLAISPIMTGQQQRQQQQEEIPPKQLKQPTLKKLNAGDILNRPNIIDQKKLEKLRGEYQNKLQQAYREGSQKVIDEVKKEIERRGKGFKNKQADERIIELMREIKTAWEQLAEEYHADALLLAEDAVQQALGRTILTNEETQRILEQRLRLNTNYIRTRIQTITDDIVNVFHYSNMDKWEEGITQILTANEFRAASFAGNLWTLPAQIMAESAFQAGVKVWWWNVPDSVICPTCEQMGFENPHTQENLPVLPGDGTECNGRCRCVLEILPEGEDEPPLTIFEDEVEEE